MTHHPQLDADLIVGDMQTKIESLEKEVARLRKTIKMAVKTFYLNEPVARRMTQMVSILESDDE